MTPKAVVIGYERQISKMPGLGPQVDTKFVICGDHGVVPAKWVVKGSSHYFKCCELCIRAHCRVTEAVSIDSEEHVVRSSE